MKPSKDLREAEGIGRKDRLFRGILYSPKGGPRAAKYEVDFMVGGVRYQAKSHSLREAVFIRATAEEQLGVGNRKGNFRWRGYCFPDPIDFGEVNTSHLTICGIRMRIRAGWNEEMMTPAINRFGWFTRPGMKIPYICRAGVVEGTGLVISRHPITEFVGRVSVEPPSEKHEKHEKHKFRKGANHFARALSNRC
ncbi:MAG: hypothetical protein J0M04_24800 [Verrucomicrobia bacterium]|nr:hypothetical protein [Verrucomicrobiota bacterium]